MQKQVSQSLFEYLLMCAVLKSNSEKLYVQEAVKIYLQKDV